MKLTKAEAENLMELMEIYIFTFIRDDENVDNIEWLISMADVYRKLQEVANGIDQ